MKQVCAWCGKRLGDQNKYEGEGISYGICLPCANSVLTRVPSNLKEFLDQISVPVILLDFDGVVRTANRQALARFGKSLAHISGHLAGEVFNCVYATLPGGCGGTYHCSGCVIRRSITETYETGKPVYRMPATLMQSSPENPQEIKFLISTEKFSDCIILRIFGEDLEN